MSKPIDGYKLRKLWDTPEGYIAAIIKTAVGHLCGYVGVTKEHPLYGKSASQHCDCLMKLRDKIKNEPIGNRGVIPVFCWDGETASMDVVFTVHGGITFASTGKMYPVETKWAVHWIGFDCAHAGDNNDKCDLDYCEEQCKLLAKQLRQVN